jgi:gluconolactonase
VTWQFERIGGPFGSTVTEGPVWDGQSLLFTDRDNHLIRHYRPGTGTFEEYLPCNAPSGLTFDRSGRLYACEGHLTRAEEEGRRLIRYGPGGRVEVLADRYEGKRLNAPNDVVADSWGRIWFTDPRYGDRTALELDHDSVYRLDPHPDGRYSLTRVTFDTKRPNGLALSPDEGILYVAESEMLPPEGTRQLRAYPVLADGNLGAPAILHDFGVNRGIDGMRIDSEGDIVATCGWDRGGENSRIAVFAPDGRVLSEHPTPTPPTNCCFGDADLQTLYVTGYDGALYRARTSRRGLRRDVRSS